MNCEISSEIPRGLSGLIMAVGFHAALLARGLL